MIKFSISTIALLILLPWMFVFPEFSWCDDQKIETSTQEAPSKKEKDFLTAYYHYAKKKVDQKIPDVYSFWGRSTGQCPKGFFAIEFDIHYMRADTHYLDNGKYGSIIQPVALAESGSGEDFGRVDANLKGHTFFWDFLFKYGINDQVEIFVDLPAQNSELWLDIQYEPGNSSGLTVRDEKGLYDLMESLGRPRPVDYYRSKAWELRDFSFGTRYNYFRNEIFSGLLSPKITFPTGRIADPDQAIKFGLGPQIDAGNGSFALGLAHGFDLRPPGLMRFLLLSTNVDYDYFFRGERTTPAFSKPDSAKKKSMKSAGLNMELFPDLSDISDSYYVTPGHRIKANATFMLRFPWVGAGVGYEFHWESEPLVESSDKDFRDLMELLGSHTERNFETLNVILEIPFFWLKIPISAEFETRFPIGGKNHPRYVDTLKGNLLVLFPL